MFLLIFLAFNQEDGGAVGKKKAQHLHLLIPLAQQDVIDGTLLKPLIVIHNRNAPVFMLLFCSAFCLSLHIRVGVKNFTVCGCVLLPLQHLLYFLKFPWGIMLLICEIIKAGIYLRPRNYIC